MRPILAALAATTAFLAAVPAMAVTFDFSFTNVLYGNVPVAGTVSGLVNNATGPGDVEITSNPAGFGTGAYNGNAANSFTVANGAMISLFYQSFGNANDPATDCCSLVLTSGTGAGLSNSPNGVARSEGANVTFTLVPDDLAPVPLPAPLALLAGGLALLAAVGRRRPRAAA
jgi:hypothetical protein